MFLIFIFCKKTEKGSLCPPRGIRDAAKPHNNSTRTIFPLRKTARQWQPGGGENVQTVRCLKLETCYVWLKICQKSQTNKMQFRQRLFDSYVRILRSWAKSQKCEGCTSLNVVLARRRGKCQDCFSRGVCSKLKIITVTRAPMIRSSAPLHFKWLFFMKGFALWSFWWRSEHFSLPVFQAFIHSPSLRVNLTFFRECSFEGICCADLLRTDENLKQISCDKQ